MACGQPTMPSAICRTSASKLSGLVRPDGADDDGDDSDTRDEGEDMDNDDVSEPQDERWFAKATPIIDLVNETSKKVCKFPAFCVSIDEQMKKLKGRSGQTF